MSEASTSAEKTLAFPGTLLTTGDIAIRRILQKHGFTEDEARIMTLTAEPFTQWGQSGAHLRGFGWDVTFPFKRTPINIAEQGGLRTPILGSIMQASGAARGTRAADPLKLQAIQQGLGIGVGVGAEQIGENIEDPNTAKALRRFVTNAAGPYSLQAGLGYGIGRAKAQGNATPVRTGVRSLPDQLPIPSVEPIQDFMRFMTDPENAEVPRGAYPKAALEQLQMVYDRLNPPEHPFAPRRRRR